MKLKGRGEIKLHPLTFAQRTECENIGTVSMGADERIYRTDAALARNRWCFYGLGLEDINDLHIYSSPELSLIQIEVMKEATKAKDPTAGG